MLKVFVVLYQFVRSTKSEDAVGTQEQCDQIVELLGMGLEVSPFEAKDRIGDGKNLCDGDEDRCDQKENAHGQANVSYCFVHGWGSEMGGKMK